MSNSSQKETFLLHIKAEPNVEVIVYDGYNKEVYRGYGVIEKSFPKGFYIIRSIYNGKIEEKLIRHVAENTVQIEAPAIYSAAPIEKAFTSYDYYMEAAKNWSKEVTGSAIGDNNQLDSKFFLFIRASNEQKYDGSALGNNIVLLDKERRVVRVLEENTCKQDRQKGWLVCSLRASSGQYYLRYFGKINREIPVYLFRGWQTQIFLTYHGRIVFEGMRMFLAEFRDGFLPDDENAEITDQAMKGLAYRSLSLPPKVVRKMLTGKFTNPMHGFMGAYLMLQRYEDYKDRQETIGIVIRNLKNHILKNSNAPDIKALELLYWQKTGEKIHDVQISFDAPPMFTIGFNAILAEATGNEELVPDDSIISHIAPKSYNDLVWSSWLHETSLSENLEADMYEEMTVEMPEEWLLSSIAISIQRGSQEREGHKKEDISINNLAKSAQVPLTTMRRTVKSIQVNNAIQNRFYEVAQDMKVQFSQEELIDKIKGL